MAQNENKTGMNPNNKNFEQGKKPFSQNPEKQAPAEQPERWSPDEDDTIDRRSENDVRGTQNQRKY